MIYAPDLTYSEIRAQYVVPILNELVDKAGISEVVVNNERQRASDASSSGITGTLFDDIATSGADKHTPTNSTAGDRCYGEVRQKPYNAWH